VGEPSSKKTRGKEDQSITSYTIALSAAGGGGGARIHYHCIPYMHFVVFIYSYVVVGLPSLGDDSVTTKAGKPYPKNYLQLPLYAHWVAIDIYNLYQSANQQLNAGKPVIKLLGYEIEVSKLNQVSKLIQAHCDMCLNQPDRECNGIMSNEALRCCEMTYTSFLSRTLDRFIFPQQDVGAVLHQGPTCKKHGGNPEVADQLVVFFDCDFLPTGPAAAVDSKEHDLKHAIKTSVFHSVNAISVKRGKDSWPVLISFPNTLDFLEIQVHIAVNNGVWRIPVVKGHPADRTLLCTLYAAVHLRNDEPIIYSTPISYSIPDKDCTSLKQTPTGRVHLKDSRVLKYFDTEEKIYIPNFDIVQQLLPEVRIDNVTTDSRITVLSYKYIEGSHVPQNIKEFIGILRAVKYLHEKNIVHADIRLCNCIFTGNNSFLIDFDLAREIPAKYPIGYVNYDERHHNACSASSMLKIHDRYSIAYLMQNCLHCTGPIIDPLLPIDVVIEHITGVH
jgi:hypothetical protein